MINDLNEKTRLVHSATLHPQQAGKLFSLPRGQANWEWMSFFVHRLQPGDVLQTRTEDEEAAFVILGGTCYRRLGSRAHISGKTQECFRWASLHALFAGANGKFRSARRAMCEIAECRVPSKAQPRSPGLSLQRKCRADCAAAEMLLVRSWT